MNYALVGPEGQIDRIQGNIDPTVQTKRGWKWLPVERKPAPLAGALEAIQLSQEVLVDKVTDRWTVTRRPLDEQQRSVKAEAERRILERWPVFRQLNIIRKGGKPMEDMGVWIDAVRDAADALIAINPIPLDYTDDKRWPV